MENTAIDLTRGGRFAYARPSSLNLESPYRLTEEVCLTAASIPGRYTKIGIKGANHVIGRPRREPLRLITIPVDTSPLAVTGSPAQ